MTTIPQTFKIKVAMTLIKSQNVYKGPFENVDDLKNVQALNGDYADIYETGTRWQYVEGVWKNTGDAIPVDSQYAQSKDVSVLPDANTIAQRDENGHVFTTTPESSQHSANKQYVDDADAQLQSLINAESAERDSAINALQTSLNEEVTRATGKEASLEESIHGLDDDITAENTRAEAAEEELQNDINATNLALQAETQRAKTAENANEQAVNAEQIRAKAAEETLQQAINSLSDSSGTSFGDVTKAINDEKTRALTAEEALSEEVGTKLTQVTNTAIKQRTYAVNTAGEQVMLDIDTAKTEGTLAQRNAQGQLSVADPTADEHAATKKYVDDVDVVHQGQLQALEAEVADETKRAKAAEGVLADAIDEEIARAKQAEQANTASASANATEITKIKAVIPNAATASNQLADKEFVNSSIANNASNYVTSTAQGDSQFASLDALQAGPWYLMGESYTPTKNDYAIFVNTDGSVWRAVYDGQFWVAAYKVNDTPFTAAQNQALNSGVTATLLANIANDIANRVVTTALASVLYGTDANGEQITKAISDFATAAQGLKADSAYQKPSTGIPQTDLAQQVQQALELARTALQSFTEQDPTVPAWAKNPTKPSYTKGEVGLGNVNNTSDANKPVSTAQQAAIDAVEDQAVAAQSDIDAHIANKNNPHAVTAAQTGAEPAFTKNTAFNKSFGTTANTVCEGNDSRLSNARTPTSHASSATTYGPGSNTSYGHVKLSGTDTTGTSDTDNTALRYRYLTATTQNLNNFRSEGFFTLYNVTSRTNFPANATVPSTPSYHLCVFRMYASDAVVQLLFVRGTNEIWIRYSTSSTSWGAWERVGGASAPYVVTLSTSSWSGSSGNFSYSITAATHKKGQYPQVRTFVNNEETYDSPKVDSSGNITLYSNAKIALRVVVY